MIFFEKRIRMLLIICGASVVLFLGYNLFIEIGSSNSPCVVSISELERNTPRNRNLTITGSACDLDHALKYSEGRKGENKIEYYIPLKDKNLIGVSSIAPKIILKMKGNHFNEIENGTKDFDSNNIQCLRLTHFDFESSVKKRLENAFGSSVEGMIVVEYMRKPKGAGIFLVAILLGVGLVYLFINPPGKPTS